MAVSARQKARLGMGSLSPVPRSPFAGLAALCVLAGCLLVPAVAPPMSGYDAYVPACDAPVPDPAPDQFMRWSDARTWGGSPVPGVGATRGANVTVFCGQAILLDLPAVELTSLNIRGTLKFLDSPALPSINLTASFVLVQGRLIIGAPDAQFSQKATILLIPNPNNRANFTFTERLPAEPAFPRSLGQKALAVVGGQVDLHGMPGSAATPSWVKLGASAAQGDRSIVVRGDVSGWPAGAPLVLTPTDFSANQESIAVITNVTGLGNGLWQIGLDRGLAFNHYGDPLGVPDGFGGYIDETAEVALLSRNIVIMGLDEPPPNELEGGHLIVFQTQTKQLIEGVQFLYMGQQGKLGRYNIHFHVCGDLSGDRSPVVRKNLVIHSKQRCVVVHATHNVTIDSNVAYNTSGHCFMIEEGGEQNNTFISNLGLRTRAVRLRIPMTLVNFTSEESDDIPSTFWITNPVNNYINNIAAGSDDSGFWFEFRGRVRGLSYTMPTLWHTTPKYMSDMGIYSGNSAHSNNFAGIRHYPIGWDPRVGCSVNTDACHMLPVAKVSLGGFTLWKNGRQGVFIHKVQSVDFTNFSYADNVWAVNLAQVQSVRVTKSRFVGVSNNYGTPTNCQASSGRTTCAPITGCAFPLPAGARGRSVPQNRANQTIIGVAFGQNRNMENGGASILLADSTFSAFDPRCSPAAAIGAGYGIKNYWNAGHAFRNVSFDSATVTNPIFLFPAVLSAFAGGVYLSGSIANSIAIRDMDGSVIGAPGYVVANYTPILLPSCRPLPNSYGLACPGSCFRSVRFTYSEPVAAAWFNSSTPRPWGVLSYVVATRLEDGATFTIEGNYMSADMDPDDDPTTIDATVRQYTFSIAAGFTYEVRVVAGTSAPAFVPDTIITQFLDGPACGVGISLRFMGSTDVPYDFVMGTTSESTSVAPCPGNEAAIAASVASLQHKYVCYPARNIQVLQVDVGPTFYGGWQFVVLSTITAPANCSAPQQCGLVAPQSTWQVNQLGQDLREQSLGGPGAFYNPAYQASAPDWVSGSGPFGSSFGRYRLLPTGSQRMTYYFRTTFVVQNSSCVTAITLSPVVSDGVAIYLNNVEVYRSNLPAGTLSNGTRANSNLNALDSNYQYIYSPVTIVLGVPSMPGVALVEGTNYLAAEVHMNYADINFAMRATAVYNPRCTGAKVSPEVCDGLDNDNDGTVDRTSSGQPLTRPCKTACGPGVETCTLGGFSGCTGPPLQAEICNGIDDDCDGIVDDGLGQLDCPAGNACFAGQCKPVLPLVTPQVLWTGSAANWYYFDKGGNLDPFPAWRNASVPNSASWLVGPGPFGVYPVDPTQTFGTVLDGNLKNTITVRYFLKSFTLSPQDAQSTYGYTVAVRRSSGAIVWLNSQELFRSNMPAGNISFNSFAAMKAGSTNPTSSNNAVSYYASGILQGNPGVSGTNWIAAQLHPAANGEKNWAFDMALTRQAVNQCPNGGGDLACVRFPPVPDTVFLRRGFTWQFLDARLPLPDDTWKTRGFDDSSWYAGVTPLGNIMGSPLVYGRTLGTARQTYYFRRTVEIPDGPCFYNLTANVMSYDGVVLYINGVEALRVNMPAGPVTPLTPATRMGSTYTYYSFQLTAGFLVAGTNVFAAELHQAPKTASSYAFDFTLSGQREAMNCSPQLYSRPQTTAQL